MIACTSQVCCSLNEDVIGFFLLALLHDSQHMTVCLPVPNFSEFKNADACIMVSQSFGWIFMMH
jgi:hypothetical protein